MRDPIIIGLGHVARVGKDAAADHLVRHYGFEKQGFTDALNRLLLAINPDVKEIVEVRCYGDWEIAKDAFPRVREAQQLLGQSVRENLTDDTWVRALAIRWAPGGRYVVKNVRYPNEAEAIQERGGFNIRIDRPGHGPVNGHISETALANWRGWDAVVQNNDDLPALYRSLDALMVTYGIQPVVPLDTEVSTC